MLATEKPEDWVPLLVANETVRSRRFSIDSDTYKFGSLSANYGNRSVVWYDTAVKRVGRIITMDINTTLLSVAGYGSTRVSRRQRHMTVWMDGPKLACHQRVSLSG